MEFITNREQNFPGFQILADCIDPEFDQRSMSNSLLKQQVGRGVHISRRYGANATPTIATTCKY